MQADRCTSSGRVGLGLSIWNWRCILQHRAAGCVVATCCMEEVETLCMCVCVWERVFTTFSTVYHCAFVWGLGKPLIICDLSGGLLLVHARVWWLEWRTWALERQRRQRRWTTVMSVSGWHGISSCLAVVYCCNRLHTPRWAGRSLRTETQTNFLRLSPICLGWRGRKGGLGSGWRVRFVIKVE